MSDLTATIASVCASTTISSLDDATIEHAVRSLDRVLCLGTTQQRDPRIARIDRTIAGPTGLTMIEGIGPTRQYVPSTATLMIASAASLGSVEGSFSDRVASAVVASAFVAAQIRDCSGAQLIVGIALGCEIAERTRVALGDEHERRGWDPVGTAGRIGATCAASVALGNDATQIHNALGFASTMAAGMRIAGSELMALGVGKTAADALEASMLAREGLIGPPEPMAGRRGLFALTAPKGDLASVIEGLGARWHDFAVREPLELAEVARDLLAAPRCQPIVTAFHRCIEREIAR